MEKTVTAEQAVKQLSVRDIFTWICISQRRIFRFINNLGKLYCLLAAFFLMHPLFSQTIDYQRKSNAEIVDFESSQNSILTDTIKYGILKNPINDLNTLIDTKAIIFKRTDDSFNPKLHVWYHFDSSFQELKGKKYNWGVYNPSLNPANQPRSFKEKEFAKKYELLKYEISTALGAPVKTETIADNKYNIIKETFWEDTNQFVTLSMKFTRLLQEPLFELGNDFEVAVMITYK